MIALKEPANLLDDASIYLQKSDHTKACGGLVNYLYAWERGTNLQEKTR